ncbi:MAG: UDP-glucose/GDP-mannose dehydrogenase family protein [Acidobacteriia bacterium]|nr:UDP-glucose/GDP-mannose dehydrogenase family protein [Terriglobia bacterium]
MRVTVIGTGYVGLVCGVGLADFGLNVTCVDCNQQRISALQRGEMPIYEIGLEEILKRCVKNHRLKFSTDLKTAIQQAAVIIVAVGTPEGANGKPDLSQIETVAQSLASSIQEYKVIVVKSTVPLGTTRRLNDLIKKQQKRKVKFDIVYNPEFLREGTAIEDFMRPNRVVIGSDSKEATRVVKEIYRPLYIIETPFIVTTPEAAEMIKYASNTFLATKITFINEVANLCEKIGADVHHVAYALGLDKRIGSMFLHPGPGFGGSCFPKDVRALVEAGKELNSPQRLAEIVLQINQAQSEIVVAKIDRALQGLDQKRIGVLGLSFKPNTDDVRESPSLAICKKLVENHAIIQAYDPVAVPNSRKVLSGEGVIFCENAYDAVTKVDGLVIATEWNEFRNIDLIKVKSLMKNPVVIDTRNIFEPQKMKKIGFQYFGQGR